MKTKMALANASSREMLLPHDVSVRVWFPIRTSFSYTAYSSNVGVAIPAENTQVMHIIAICFCRVISFSCPWPCITCRLSNETATRVYIELLITSIGQQLTTLQWITPERMTKAFPLNILLKI